MTNKEKLLNELTTAEFAFLLAKSRECKFCAFCDEDNDTVLCDCEINKDYCQQFPMFNKLDFCILGIKKFLESEAEAE